ncbi:MAG: type II toxin-antitoxin system YafQ family toxin [Oscillospiraceae bacterium]|nr:type II toxin-antitoxin system YafQ family toxin [Oscillospiraceae bacterium]
MSDGFSELNTHKLLYRLQPTSKFKKDIKRLKKRGFDLSLLKTVVTMLACGMQLPRKYCDHPLKGNKKGYRDCHILDNWVLIYKIDKDLLILVLSETGTHADILD